MADFFDADKFFFADVVCEDGITYREPRHYRDLGRKDGCLYKTASWSDVVIHDVPLDETINFSFEIDYVEQIRNQSQIGGVQGATMVTMVNGRENIILPPDDSEFSVKVSHRNKWLNRLQKISLNPMTLPEAKKKRKSIERFPVKPKGKKQVRDEKLHSSADKFQEITDEKLGGESVLDYTIYIQKKGDYKIIEELDTMALSDPWYPHRYIIYKVPIRTKYCPPLHWLEPEVQWEKIWCHVDELKTGEKRAYDYFPTGFQDFIIGLKARCTSSRPCIFFDDDSGEFVGSRDYMDENEYWGMNYVSDYYHY